MTSTFLPADVLGTVAALYTRANIAPLKPLETVVPLSDLIGSFPGLGVREIAKLTLSKVCADRGVPFDGAEEDLSGFLFANCSYGIIYVDREDPITRRRFTIAHELGHFLLHFTPAFERASKQGQVLLDLTEAFPNVKDSEKDDEQQLTGWVKSAHGDALPLLPPLAQMEKEADLFAAELLMPPALTINLWTKFRTVLHGNDLVRRLAADMLVSRAAMNKRLRSLNLMNTD